MKKTFNQSYDNLHKKYKEKLPDEISEELAESVNFPDQDEFEIETNLRSSVDNSSENLDYLLDLNIQE